MPAYPAWTDRANGRRIYGRPGGIHLDGHNRSADQSTTVAATEWLATIGRRWRGGHLPHLARLLAEAADPTTGVITLDSDTLRRLLNQVRLRVHGFKRLLDILVSHGFLTPTDPAPGQKLGSYRLALRDDSRG